MAGRTSRTSTRSNCASTGVTLTSITWALSEAQVCLSPDTSGKYCREDAAVRLSALELHGDVLAAGIGNHCEFQAGVGIGWIAWIRAQAILGEIARSVPVQISEGLDGIGEIDAIVRSLKHRERAVDDVGCDVVHQSAIRIVKAGTMAYVPGGLEASADTA